MYISFLKKTPFGKFHKFTGQAITFSILSKHYGRTKLQITNVLKKSVTFVMQIQFFLFEFYSKINLNNIFLSCSCTSRNLDNLNFCHSLPVFLGVFFASLHNT